MGKKNLDTKVMVFRPTLLTLSLMDHHSLDGTTAIRPQDHHCLDGFHRECHRFDQLLPAKQSQMV